MSGETARQESGWTVDTSRTDILRIVDDLEKYVERRFTDQDKAVQAALQAAKEAVIKAEAASEKRFDSVNEFRKTLSDQTNTFLPRPEYDANHKALEDKIDAVTTRIDKNEGKSSGISTVWGSIGVGIGLLIAAVSVILAFND